MPRKTSNYMEAQLQYILDLAKQFKPLIDQSKLLFEALNQLPKEELLDIYAVYGDPDLAHISTSFAERSNLTMRMNMRRFTRITYVFSKKV